MLGGTPASVIFITVAHNTKKMSERRKKRLKFKKIKPKVSEEFYQDPNFAFIAGYTSGGFPYGITHEEMEDIKEKEERSKNQ
jgi:hypothetical protein